MRKILSIFILLTIVLSLSACVYIPPEGWTKEHHGYKEVLAFAKSIDANAIVAEEYTDIVNENNWQFREWDAVIKGVECHVASVTDWVWNKGFAAGEFAKNFYRIDTDYDYTVMNNLLSEKYRNWNCEEDIYGRYHTNTNTIYVKLVLPEYRMLNEDELEHAWQTACEINEEYQKHVYSRKVEFGIPSPVDWGNCVNRELHTYISAFTEEGKEAFFRKYQENWALLESGSPLCD